MPETIVFITFELHIEPKKQDPDTHNLSIWEVLLRINTVIFQLLVSIKQVDFLTGLIA